MNNLQSQKFVLRVIATAFILQAVIIGVKGNIDVQSGKPILDVIPWMIIQDTALMLKVLRTQKSVEESDRIKKNRTTQNPDD
jgi:hypothetical protein